VEKLRYVTVGHDHFLACFQFSIYDQESKNAGIWLPLMTENLAGDLFLMRELVLLFL